jgi:Domain of unknown function (DUF4194)
MSWSTERETSANERDVRAGQGEGSAPPLRSFAGDLGELPIETRRVLVQLLLGPTVDAQRQTKLWPVLVRDERVIRARLHELFLDLVIDHDQQVAYTRQVVDLELEIPVLLRRASLTLLQSALLLYLREQLILAEARGERAVVSRDEMQEHLAAYQPADSRDQAKFTKQTAGAVERADKLNLLRKLRGADERYEISPALKLLFSAEEILALTKTYERIAEGGGMGLDEERDTSELSGEP